MNINHFYTQMTAILNCALTYLAGKTKNIVLFFLELLNNLSIPHTIFMNSVKKKIFK